MSAAARHSRLARVAAGLMLAAFAARAPITAGFMPADGSFALEICPEGFPAELLQHPGGHHHHHHHQSGAQPGGGEHCVFAAAAPGGPVSHLPTPVGAGPAALAPILVAVVFATPVRLVHLPQARAPPASV